VLGHRGKLRKLDADFEDAWFVRQLMCLRLAVILCHARRDPDLEGLQLHHEAGHTISLRLRSDWSASYPQSVHLLREEALAWQKTPWTLTLLSET
jgi:exopolyphosphatase / guanosine-5'-triphosphate,3'-diphosphate pyrophosphatase